MGLLWFNVAVLDALKTILVGNEGAQQHSRRRTAVFCQLRNLNPTGGDLVNRPHFERPSHVQQAGRQSTGKILTPD